MYVRMCVCVCDRRGEGEVSPIWIPLTREAVVWSRVRVRVSVRVRIRVRVRVRVKS